MPTIGADGAAGGCADQPLLTARLMLRRPVAADVPDIVHVAKDWEVARFTANVPHPYSSRDAERWIARTAEGHAAGTQHSFACLRREDGALIGVVGLRVRRDENLAALGYMLGLAYWGQGYATEAVRRVLRFAFEELGVASVRGACVPDNGASARVMEKAGMALVGREVEVAPARGCDNEVDVRAIGRDDWLRNHALPVVLVSAVALLDADGRVLLARRPVGRPMAGLWEFPGGKVADKETPEAALIRELREEIGVDTAESCLAPLTFASHRYDDFHLLMTLFVCRVWRGAPTPREGQELAWVRPGRLADHPMPPADIPLAAMLRDFL